MKRLILAFVGAAALATSAGAVTAPSVKFSDEKLSNGLRLIKWTASDGLTTPTVRK